MSSWVKSIDAITLFVEDVAATKAFYLEVFDLPLHYEDPNSAVLKFGDTLINLLDGERARVLAESAGAELVSSRPAARDWVRRNAREGDRVLIKGSHSTHLDEVVRELTEA